MRINQKNELKKNEKLARTWAYEMLPITLEELTLQNTVKEAMHALVKDDLIQDRVKSGSTRAGDAFIVVGEKLKEYTIEEAACSRWAFFYMRKIAKNMSNNSANNVVSKISVLFDVLKQIKLVEENPWTGIKRLPKETVKERRVLSDDEVAKLVKHLDGLRVYTDVRRKFPKIYGDMVMLGRLTAMRYGELVNLRSGKVNLETGIAMVSEFMAKTRKARRVALSEEAIAILRPYLEATESDDKDARVFPVAYGALQEAVRRYGKKIGKSMHFHLLRHTAITRYLEENGSASLMEAQTFSGHATESGIRTYMHPDSDDMIERVRSRLNKKKK